MSSEFRANPDEAEFELGTLNDEEYEMGRVLSGKARKRLRKVFLAPVVKPLQLAHKVTHGKNSPIRKMELKLQGVVGKVLPFTKPFIAAHNKISENVYKGMEKTGLTKKGSTLLASPKAVSPTVAAAQMAAGATLRGNVNAGLSAANAQALNSSPEFRTETLTNLLNKSNGGNQSATLALSMLSR